MNREEKSKLFPRVKTFTRDAHIREVATQIGDTRIVERIRKC